MAYSDKRPALMMDIECYPNYFLIAFKVVGENKYKKYILAPQLGFAKLDIPGLKVKLKNYRIVTFNGTNYDMPILALALTGASNIQLKRASDDIIENGVKYWYFYDKYDCRFNFYIDHIDIIEVCKGQASLKMYAGRLHCEKMQDLPYDPDDKLTERQAEYVAKYCYNDLENTELVYNHLFETQVLPIRIKMSDDYGIDLRSKSDAQIAEALFKKLVRDKTGITQKPSKTIKSKFRYVAPKFVSFKTEQLQQLLIKLQQILFKTNPHQGKVDLPDEVKQITIKIGNSSYNLGIGGLHSQESNVSHYSDCFSKLCDADVASFYPTIILLSKIFPESIGLLFLDIYGKIVSDRLQAKRSGDKYLALVLKIVINGIFGKLGSKYSIFCAPELLIHVTLTGQLCLLMLIERLELAGIKVVSANTDGVVSDIFRHKVDLYHEIAKQWESDTGFELEFNEYKSLHSLSVNDYFAIIENDDGSLYFKRKGGTCAESDLERSPPNQIAVEAVINYVAYGTPVSDTILASQDITKFISLQKVTGGASWRGTKIGKTIRWYYSTEVGNNETIINNKGHCVARSAKAKPMMQMPDEFPDDVDFNWYINEANSILNKLQFPIFNKIKSDKRVVKGVFPGQSTAHFVKTSNSVALCGKTLDNFHNQWDLELGESAKRICSKCRELV